MEQTAQVFNGNGGEIYVNGKLRTFTTKVSIKISGDFDDQTFIGEFGTFSVYNGYKIEGSFTELMCDSDLAVTIAEAYSTGIMPDIVIIPHLFNPATKQSERWSFSGIVFTEIPIEYEAKKSVEREWPWKANRFKNLEAAE